MQDISKILSSLGLLDSEIKTYLAALKNGPGTVLEITKETKLSRQATYTAIQQLTDRGLMSSVLRGKKQFYAAETPDKLLSYAKRKQEEMNEQLKDLKKAIPELQLRAGGQKPVVRMFEGKEGVKAMLNDLADSKPPYVEEIGDIDAIFKILSVEDLAEFRKVLGKINTKFVSIYSGKPRTPGPLPQRYFLPDKYGNFKGTVIITPDKVTFATFKGKMYSVIIDDKQIAETMHILYQLALEGAGNILKAG